MSYTNGGLERVKAKERATKTQGRSLMWLPTLKKILHWLWLQNAEKMKAVEKEKTNGAEAEAYIMSIFKKYAGGKASVSDLTAETPADAAIPSSLKSIIKCAKHAKSD
jgi:hypothetical protein